MTFLHTSVGIISLRVGTADDLSAVMDIIAEAAARLERKGIQQWPSPPNTHWWRRMAEHLTDREIHLAEIGNELLGLIRITWTDPYWPGDTDEAGYIHSLTIRNRVRGHGVGAVLLSWAIDHIREQRKVFARLDCQSSNTRLRRYYEEHGFIHRKEVIDRDYSAALYEMKLSKSSE